VNEHKFTYDYPRPALTADIVLLTHESAPNVLLIRRKKPPYEGCWALPGGFVDEGETLEQAAHRELIEETGVAVESLEQLFTVGDPGRDPRGWTVSVAFIARVDASAVQPRAGDDAAEAGWHPLADLPEMAFDHRMILNRVAATV
jgi:8-oxo-dGTP diphosphatase